MMKDNPYKTATFLTSVVDLKKLPPDEGCEIAIVGRSNVGKSTALNKITENKQLAKVSKTPGRTQMINFFSVDATRRIVDLPGYGYAKVPSTIRERFFDILPRYFQTRRCLRGILLLIDIRRLITPLDAQMIALARHTHCPVHILLTKCDKLSRAKGMAALADCQKQLGSDVNLSIQLFSATRRVGIETALNCLNQWFEISDTPCA